MKPEAAAGLDRLAAVAAGLEAELAGAGAACRACGECCHLARLGARLIVSEGEVRWLTAKAPPPGPAAPGVCPYLGDGKCAGHRRRPLGCRSYFCDERFRALGEEAGRRAWNEWIAACRAAGEEPAVGELLDMLPPAEPRP